MPHETHWRTNRRRRTPRCAGASSTIACVIGGMTLSDLAQRVGRTPFYAYDREAIADRVALLRRHVPAGVDLHYAIKANPMPALVAFVAGLVDGLDVASAGELAVALDGGMPPAEISFAGPGKSESELRQAFEAGILVNVESTREINILAQMSRATGRPARVAVRVNPDFELKSSGMKMGGWSEAVRHRRGERRRCPGLDRPPWAVVRRLSHFQRIAESARRGDLRSSAQDD